MSIFLWDSEPSKIFVGDNEVSKVFVWDTQVRPSGWWGWQPWVNTILYLPLERDVKDYSLNDRWTFSNIWTLWQKGWVDCRYCWTTWRISLGTSASSYLETSTNQFTCSAWLYSDWQNSYNSRFLEFNVNGGIGIWIGYGLANSTDSNFWTFGGSAVTFSSIATAQTWVNLIIVNNDGSFTLYKNWQLFDTWTDNTNHWFGNGMVSQNWCNIAWNRTSEEWVYDNESLNWWIREFIWEDKARTSTDASNYYNSMKSYFWH